MSELSVQQAPTAYRPSPDHNPRSRQDRYRRVHYYVSQMGMTVSGQLRQALMTLRNAADQLNSPELREIARKQYTEEEFLPACKEILCIWIHLEAVDQGGEMMPAWLMNYLKLALYATDYLIDRPQAMAIMDSHADCADLPSLFQEVALTTGEFLGFGAHAATLAPAIKILLANSRPLRQRLLKDSLTLSIE